MSGSEWGQLPNASSGMRYILIRALRYKMYRPLRNAGSVEKVGVAPDPKRVGPASRNLEYG